MMFGRYLNQPEPLFAVSCFTNNFCEINRRPTLICFWLVEVGALNRVSFRCSWLKCRASTTSSLST